MSIREENLENLEICGNKTKTSKYLMAQKKKKNQKGKQYISSWDKWKWKHSISKHTGCSKHRWYFTLINTYVKKNVSQINNLTSQWSSKRTNQAKTQQNKRKKYKPEEEYMKERLQNNKKVI